MLLTNNSDISLALAVWVANDEYDYVNEDNYISATKLMKPLRHIVLPSRVPVEERKVPDVEDYIATSLGHSIHDSIEKSWTKNYRKNLAKLGYPEEVINRVLINPSNEELAAKKDAIPIYLEQRAIREIKVRGVTYKIGGKYDFLAEGGLQDFKSTTSFTWVHGTRDDEHMLQGSIYRWLNPDKVTEDFIKINYIFTDWRKADALSNMAYPQKRLMSKDIAIMEPEETEEWITKKLELIHDNWDKDEKLIPECTREELWISDPQYKYYSDPTKVGGRSTKNFTDPIEANKFKAEKGKGIVVTVEGEPKRCGYCDAFTVCTQKDKYFS